ncbi:MAG: hypothetical protein GKR97_04285 [Rhizobiaceae bacterium]|nr:hypothetical protein [Rhizobiaceae bacterium]
MADNRPPMLQNSLIVAAHPDDELLWFGAILKQVDQVIVVFEDFWPDPKIGPARAKALDNFPRDNVSSLRMAEAATYGCANWDNPQVSPFGIELGWQCQLRDAKQSVLRILGRSNAPKDGIRTNYRQNFDALSESLRGKLTPDMNVFSHNPWGEYGHEDHVQVHRVLSDLREEIGFTLWMTNYCTERTLPLAKTYFDTAEPQYQVLSVDKQFADQVAQVYRDAGCWTWADDWKWFNSECYMQAPKSQTRLKGQGHLFPLNLFNIDPT